MMVFWVVARLKIFRAEDGGTVFLQMLASAKMMHGATTQKTTTIYTWNIS
jgi:hypothetical protein